MKTLWRSMILAALIAVILAAGVQPASAVQERSPILYGTTGTCDNARPGGPCTGTSTLYQIDSRTGALVKEIGPVGYVINGLAWDTKSEMLYASTSIGCGVESVCTFHGLITINTKTGAGTPVNPAAPNFGLAVHDDGTESPIHSITIDSRGRMVGWYDEGQVGPDTLVQIDKKTGVATEIPTEINTNQNGLSFNNDDQLWNIDTVRILDVPPQTAYLIDRKTGKPLRTVSLSPPTMAALGDFNPVNDLYYGLSFLPPRDDPTRAVSIVVVNLRKGTVTMLGKTVNNLHTLAFAKKVDSARDGVQSDDAFAELDPLLNFRLFAPMVSKSE